MMPSAGAMAAPAITVSSDIDRMVAVTFLETLICSIKSVEFQLYQAIESLFKIGCNDAIKSESRTEFTPVMPSMSIIAAFRPQRYAKII